MRKNNKDTIVSRYISDPLLLNGYKFDLRIYIVITSVDPLRIYMYEEGLARFATEKFTLNTDEIKDKFVHLTNFSINKNSDKFFIDQNDDGVGNKWSLAALNKKLREMGIDVETIWMNIEDILIKTILSIEDKLFKAAENHVPYRNNCYNLLGFDVLVDTKLKPWLLEVNLNPSLGVDSQLDLKIKSNLLADIFTLVGVSTSDQREAAQYMKNNSLFATNNPYDDSNKQDNGKKLRHTELAIISETRDEIQRAQRFKIIYPTYNASMYKPFFDEDRPNNVTLRSEIVKNLGRIKDE